MRVVWKYKIEPGRITDISMPEHSNILHVGSQGHDAYIWVLVDAISRPVVRRFLCVATGVEFKEKAEYYHGTFFVDSIVFHVFEIAGENYGEHSMV